jgi:hypothetical protein
MQPLAAERVAARKVTDVRTELYASRTHTKPGSPFAVDKAVSLYQTAGQKPVSQGTTHLPCSQLRGVASEAGQGSLRYQATAGFPPPASLCASLGVSTASATSILPTRAKKEQLLQSVLGPCGPVRNLDGGAAAAASERGRRAGGLHEAGGGCRGWGIWHSRLGCARGAPQARCTRVILAAGVRALPGRAGADGMDDELDEALRDSVHGALASQLSAYRLGRADADDYRQCARPACCLAAADSVPRLHAAMLQSRAASLPRRGCACALALFQAAADSRRGLRRHTCGDQAMS